jgi:hypothetical protein
MSFFIAAIDMPVPAGLLIAGFLILLSAWYWQRLGGEQFLPSTRALRRGTLVLGVLAIFALLRGACFVDSEVAPREYVMTWLSVLGLIFLTVLMLVVDIVNSFRIHRREFMAEALASANRLKAEIAHAKKSDATSSGTRRIEP